MALKRSLAWMGLAQVCTFIVQFAASVVLARLLTPYQMGIYAVAAATAGVLSIVQAFGLQSLIVREETLTPEITATAFSVNLIIAVSLAAAIFGLSYLGGAFLHDVGVRHVLMALSVGPLFGIFDFLPAANLQRNGRFKAISIISTVSGLTAAISTIVLALLGFKYMSVAYAGWAGAAAYGLLMNVVGREYIGFRIGFQAWRRVANFGLQMLAVSGVNALSSRLSDIILGRFLGLGGLGIFNRASGLNGLVWNNIHLVIGRVVFVDYAELNRQGVPLRERYMATVEIVTAVLWPAFGGLGLLAGPFIRAVYGAKWLPAAQPLALLAIASMIQVAITMTWELFAATGQLKAQTRIEFIRTGLSLAVFAAACTISLTAAAATRVVDALFALLFYRPHLDRMTKTSMRDFAPIYARSLLLTSLALAPAALLMTFYRMSPDVPLQFVLASVGSGVALWAAGLVALKHPLAREAICSLRGRRGERFESAT